jgi:hypothetical protein
VISGAILSNRGPIWKIGLHSGAVEGLRELEAVREAGLITGDSVISGAILSNRGPIWKIGLQSGTEQTQRFPVLE